MKLMEIGELPQDWCPKCEPDATDVRPQKFCRRHMPERDGLADDDMARILGPVDQPNFWRPQQ